MDWLHVFTFEGDDVVEVAGYQNTDAALAAERAPART